MWIRRILDISEIIQFARCTIWISKARYLTWSLSNLFLDLHFEIWHFLMLFILNSVRYLYRVLFLYSDYRLIFLRVTLLSVWLIIMIWCHGSCLCGCHNDCLFYRGSHFVVMLVFKILDCCRSRTFFLWRGRVLLKIIFSTGLFHSDFFFVLFCFEKS